MLLWKQRRELGSFRVIKDLEKELTYNIDNENEPINSAEDGRINDYIQDLPNIKLGIKVPKSYYNLLPVQRNMYLWKKSS